MSDGVSNGRFSQVGQPVFSRGVELEDMQVNLYLSHVGLFTDCLRTNKLEE
jgi:hypothetical protein